MRHIKSIRQFEEDKKLKRKLFGKSAAIALAALMASTTLAGTAFAEETAGNQTAIEAQDVQLNAQAEIVDEGTCGENVTWTLDSTGLLSISGSGAMSYPSYGPWFSNRTEIKKVVIANGITNVGEDAFRACTNLTSVEIPTSVTSIEHGAFYMCNALASVNIPSNVTSIGRNSFYMCSALTSINIPSNVKTIDYGAFGFCRGLTSIVLPDGITRIEESTFSNCDALVSVKIPSTVTYIAAYAFSNCSSLKNVTIPSGVTYLGSAAFCGCSSIESIEIPSGITSLEYRLFEDCESLKSIEIPSNITKIEEWAFASTGLSSVSIPATVTDIGYGAFGYRSYWNEAEGEGGYELVDGFKIYGYTGSAAEDYAKENNITFVSTGVIAPATAKAAKASYAYTGKALKPSVTVTDKNGNTIAASNYDVAYSSNVNVGTAKVTVTFINDYAGCKALTTTFKIIKAANPMKLKAASKKLKFKTLKKKKLTYTIAFNTKAQGKVTYTLSKAAKKAKIKVSSKGKITVPKGCKKGTYKITVKAAGNSNYSAVSKTFKIVVK